MGKESKLFRTGLSVPVSPMSGPWSKKAADVEFGAKVSISLVDGYAFVDKIGWDNYSEAELLPDAVERYRRRYGHYPKAVLADKLYRNRNNLRYCKERGIRLSGPRLGRPPKDAVH